MYDDFLDHVDLYDLQRKLSSQENHLTVKKHVRFSEVHNKNIIVDKYTYGGILSYYYNEFLNNTYSEYIGRAPIYVYDLDFQLAQFGNRLGNYFEAVAFAHEMGMHFVGFYHHLNEIHFNSTKSFTNKIKTVIKHDNPKDRDSIVKCLLSPYSLMHYTIAWPWSTPNRLWMKNVDFITETMTLGINGYIESSYESLNKLKVPKNTFVNISDGSYIDLIPDAVILFRCADILKLVGKGYGFINWNLYTELIPPDSKSIYIVTEPLKYGDFDNICSQLNAKLVEFLQNIYSNSTVLIRRGYPLDSMVMFKYSKTVICAPSTFCFFALFSNLNGSIYYQKSTLINDGMTATIFDSRENLKWIEYPIIELFHNQPYTIDFILSKFTASIHDKNVSSVV